MNFLMRLDHGCLIDKKPVLQGADPNPDPGILSKYLHSGIGPIIVRIFAVFADLAEDCGLVLVLVIEVCVTVIGLV